MKDSDLLKQIKDLEDSYCNPRKIKEASELREELRQRGYTDSEIDEKTR